MSEAHRTTVSMPASLHAKATKRMQERDFGNFSDYVQHLIREDTKSIVGDWPEPKQTGGISLNEEEAAKPGRKPAAAGRRHN